MGAARVGNVRFIDSAHTQIRCPIALAPTVRPHALSTRSAPPMPEAAGADSFVGARCDLGERKNKLATKKLLSTVFNFRTVHQLWFD